MFQKDGNKKSIFYGFCVVLDCVKVYLKLKKSHFILQEKTFKFYMEEKKKKTKQY